MDSLLRWSIENSTPLDSAPGDRPPVQRQDLNPEIIDMILGKPDAELMKEDMAVAIDATRSEDDRINALDHLEMLIEQIDNANNLEKLRLWEPLQSILTSDASLEIRMQVLWVIGTSVQNNPAAQDVYLKYQPLPTLVSFLTPSPSSTLQIRSKVIYALSGLLKHNAAAVVELGRPEVDGWAKLREALQDPEISVRRKTIFLFHSLLIPTSPSDLLLHLPKLIEDDPTHPPSATDGLSLLTPDDQPASAAPIHPNSHAAHLANPSRTNTCQYTFTALREHNILDAVINAVTSPVPFGEDGENVEADPDFEEKGVRLLQTYAVTCGGALSRTQKATLKTWFEAERKAKGSEDELLSSWNFTAAEFKELIGRLN